jgi:two-component system, OmpR family, sensor kinase
MGRLFWKIFIGGLLIQVAIGSAVGLAVYLHNKAQLEDMTYLAAGGPRAEFVLNAAAMALRFGGPQALQILLSDNRFTQRMPVLAVNKEGQDIFGRPVPPQAFSNAKEAITSGRASHGLREVTAPDGHNYILFIPAEINGRPAHPHPYPPEDSLFVRLGAAVLASLIFSVLLAWYLTRPVRHLQRAANALASGDMAARVAPNMKGRSDEIADLGKDFDHMADRLQNMVDTQQRLLHDVSHELRSPLARMQVAMALARQQPDKVDAALERIEREGNRLDELVGELLTLARLGAGVGMEAEGEVDLAALLETVVEDGDFEADGGRRVVLEYCDSAIFTGRGELLRRAFENVVRNALRHSPEESEVTVRAERESGWMRVTVGDRGPGLPEDKLAAVFEPFVRSGDSPTGGRSGYGLGLAITRRAIEAHGGNVRAENRDGGGLRVVLELPVSSPAERQKAERQATPKR